MEVVMSGTAKAANSQYQTQISQESINNTKKFE